MTTYDERWPSMTRFVDMGWGDWRLVNAPHTRVTAEQVTAIAAMPDVDDLGAAEVRFDNRPGVLLVVHLDGLLSEVDENGTVEAAE